MSLKCPPAARLVERAMGDLAAVEAARLDEHFASCRACRERLGEIEATLAGLRREAAQIGRTAYPGDLLEDVRTRLIAHGALHRGRGPTGGLRARWLWLAAGAGLAAAIAVTAHLRTPTPPRAPGLRSLSPFQTIADLPSAGGVAARLTLSPPPPRWGQGLSLGAGALSRLRPPSREDLVKKEER